MNSLSSLGWQIHDHLKANRPKQFQALKTQNQLLPFVKKLENQANDQLDQLEDSGMEPHEAWEKVKDSVLLPSEMDDPTMSGTVKPYHDQNLQPGMTSSTKKASPSPLDRKPSSGPTSTRSRSSSNSTLKVV